MLKTQKLTMSGRVSLKLFAPISLLTIGLFAPDSAALAQTDEQPEPSSTANASLVAQVNESIANGDLQKATQQFVEANQDVPNDDVIDAALTLYRALSDLSPEDRYEVLAKALLENTTDLMSDPVLTTASAPPAEFARAIRQRPSENVFAIPQVGSVKGWLWLEYELIRTAIESGRAVDLSRRIEAIESEENRKLWLQLFGTLDERIGAAALDAFVSKLAENSGSNSSLSNVEILTLWLASDRDQRVQPWRLNDWIAKRPIEERPAWSAAIMVESPSRDDADGQVPFQHWLTDSGPLGVTADQLVRQYADHLWMAGRNGTARLWMRYPIANHQSIAIEPLVGGPFDREGQMGFALRRVHATRTKEQFVATTLAGEQFGTWWTPYYDYAWPGNFHRLAVTRNDTASSDEKIVYSINRHPMIDHNGTGFPWLDISTVGSQQALFRNWTAEGPAKIANSVDLLAAGPEAWTSPNGQSPGEWTAGNGEVQLGNASAHAVDWYRRPLADSEQVSFECFVAGNSSSDDSSTGLEIAPVVGRIAFLISSRGVRVRWLTNSMLSGSAQPDWTSLAPDHELLEPLARKGRGELNIRLDDWNRISVARRDGNVELSLNDELIYVREHDRRSASHFGVYRPAADSKARLRDMQLTGDWPDTLPVGVLNDPFARIGNAPESKTDRAGRSVINAELIATNYAFHRRRLADQSPAEQLDRIESWLFPDRRVSRNTLRRMIGIVPPSDPSPLVLRDPAFTSLVDSKRELPRVVHPVIDWVQVARQQGTPQRIQSKLDEQEPTNPEEALALEFIRAIAAVEIGSDDDVAAAVTQLGKLLEQPNAGLPERWTYLAFFASAAERDRWTIELSNLASDGIEKWTTTPNDDAIVIATHWMRLIAEHTVADEKITGTDLRHTQLFDQTQQAGNTIITAGRFNRHMRGQGRAKPLWILNDEHALVHQSGSELDYLMLQTPLPDSYAIQATGRAFTSLAMMQEGRFYSANKDNTFFKSDLEGRKETLNWQPPKRLRANAWYTAQKQGDVLSTFVNGVPLTSESVPENAPPWVGVRAWWKSIVALQQPVVTSTQQAPQSVTISAAAHMSFWTSYYQLELGNDKWWRWTESTDPESPEASQIESQKRSPRPHTNLEGLLNYGRPMVPSERVDYRFYFEPGEFSASPAIGRTVLYVSDQGVATHYLTDARYDRTNVDPGNMQHFKPFPDGTELSAGWHSASVQLNKSSATLSIDGVEVYDSPIDSTADRFFGLFHYADTTHLRVCNVQLSGEWPEFRQYRSYLGDPITLAVEDQLADLSATFEIDLLGDFERSNADRQRELDKYFNVSDGFVWTSRGLRGNIMSTGPWKASSIRPRFELNGDFDIRLSFTDLQNEQPERMAGVRIELEDDQTPTTAVNATRARNDQGLQLASGAGKVNNPDGSPRYPGNHTDDASNSGTLRLVRVGNVVTSFFAPGDTNLFRALRQQEVSPGPIPVANAACYVLASGRGQASAVLTSVILKAESMRFTPNYEGNPPTALIARNLETGEQKTLARSKGDLYHVGSPHISRDKKWVVFNRNDENPSNSHLEVVPLDGSAPPVDIGAGAVPRFSPDGERIAFFDPRTGVGYCNRDGSNRTIISREGLPADFPTNNTVAFASRGQIWFYDIATGKTEPVLTGPQDGRYSNFSWQINFGPNGRRVAVKGSRRDPRGSELAILDLDNPSDITVLLEDAGPLRPQVSWMDDGTCLIVGYMPGFPGSGLFTVDPKKPNEYQPFKYQPDSIEPLDSDITADQKWLVITGKLKPVLQEWKGR